VRARIAAAALALAGCTNDTTLLPPVDGGVDGCTEPGPPIVLGTKDACAGALAERVQRFALCSCESLLLTRGLFTAGAMKPGPMMMPPPAAVGTDGLLEVAGNSQIAGAVVAADPGGARFDATSAILGTVRSGGPIGAQRFLSVDRDAYAAGDVVGRIDVGGTLHADPSANISPGVTYGTLAREPVMVAPPCDCAAGPQLDVAAELAAAASANDDAHIGLPPESLAAASPATGLDLPCGRYYLTALTATAELELRVHGRVGLFVAGTISLGDGLRVTLDPGATLDLVAGGDLSSAGGTIGAPMAASVRLWLGSSTVKLSNAASFSALVYAPSAALLTDGDLDTTGAVFVRSLDVPGDVGVRYDPHTLEIGGECGVPPVDPID
jgi:hypothetical protein